MDKKLQDLAWSALPKEFKEEVKQLYKAIQEKNVNNSSTERYFDGGCKYAFEKLFGIHNLTSDAEGEEMLTVPRSQIQKLYSSTKKVNDQSSKDYINGVLNTLDTLFGSKCLPDETVSNCYQLTEPKPAEPEEMRIASEESHLRNLSQNIADCDKQLDNILKDSLSKERRLNIAAMAMQGILSNESRMRRYEDMATVEPCERLTDIVARNALRYADALIAECKKGGNHEKV